MGCSVNPDGAGTGHVVIDEWRVSVWLVVVVVCWMIVCCCSLPLCNHNCQNLLDMKDNHLNIVVLGSDLLASQLISEIQVSRPAVTCLLHFAWGHRWCEMYIGHACLCVCLSVAAFPHYCTDLDVTWGNDRGTRGCAVLARFAIGAQVSLLWQHTHMQAYSLTYCKCV